MKVLIRRRFPFIARHIYQNMEELLIGFKFGDNRKFQILRTFGVLGLSRRQEARFQNGDLYRIPRTSECGGYLSAEI